MNIYEDTIVITKPQRRWLRHLGCGLKILLISALMMLISALGTWAWHHRQITQRLDEALADLDHSDPGWRLEDIEAGREEVPEQDNSARVVMAVARLLPRNWLPEELGNLLTHLEPEKQLNPADVARLTQELDSVRPALDEARKLAKMPRGRHRIVYQRNVLNTLLQDQAEVRRIVWLLVCDAMRYDQNGDTANAMISCRAALNAARSLGDEPLAVSQLIRTAAVISVCQAAERTLAQAEPASKDLEAFAHLFDSEDSFPDLFITACGERACAHALFDAIESGDVSVAELADGRPGWHERLFGFLYHDNVRAEHPTMLALMTRWDAIARLPMPEQAAAERRFNREIRALPETAILTRSLLPALTILGETSRRKHAYLRCTNAAFAAESYRRKFGAWPVTIDKLCPNYLSAVPVDPFDGWPLRYHRIEDGLLIYSVGRDAVDNNGTLERENPMQPGVDIGVRLWDAAKRRQPPRPKPLLEEQPR
ncbi:MAG TPA: hypothetical protein VMF69_12245 [Gemmataceae bacterium]|nr:hypothetical protein [Gemmataceae bacterium]